MRNWKSKLKVNEFTLLFLIGLLFFSCNSNKFNKTPIDSFIGTWELEGREMFNGIKIKIEESENGKLKGKVIKLNDNKYIKMFVEINDIWVTDISRSSNYRFKLTEKKIANSLFAMYGQKTIFEYKAEFIDNNTIGLGTRNSDLIESQIKYIRIDEN